MKSRLLRIGVAAIVAIFAAVLAFQLASSSGNSGGPFVESVDVYVSTGLIERGSTLQSALDGKLLKVATYPKDTVPSDSIGPKTKPNGAEVASTDITPGSILTNTQFLKQTELSSITGLAQGMVAVTGLFKTEESVAGLIAKGDSVAVFATDEIRDGTTTTNRTKMLINSAHVILIGEAGATADDKSNGTRLVTLGLSPLDAEKFIHAAKTATMQLVLLRPGETPSVPAPITAF